MLRFIALRLTRPRSTAHPSMPRVPRLASQQDRRRAHLALLLFGLRSARFGHFRRSSALLFSQFFLVHSCRRTFVGGLRVISSGPLHLFTIPCRSTCGIPQTPLLRRPRKLPSISTAKRCRTTQSS